MAIRPFVNARVETPVEPPQEQRWVPNPDYEYATHEVYYFVYDPNCFRELNLGPEPVKWK